MGKEKEDSLTQTIVSEGMLQDAPTVLRDRKGRIRWTLPGNTPEQNEQLGIRNIQALFLEKFPEFNVFFPRGEDGKILRDKREEANEFIIRHLVNAKDFRTTIGGSSGQKRCTPYFHGSHLVAIKSSFEPWGLDFQILETTNKRTFLSSKNQILTDSRGKRWYTFSDTPEQIKSIIEEEVKQFIASGNKFSKRNLAKASMNGLALAIKRYYPGGFTSLRKNLGIQLGRKANNYWKDTEVVERAAFEFHQSEGKLSSALLKKKKRFDLLKAITRYPGGMKALKLKLNIEIEPEVLALLFELPRNSQGKIDWRFFNDKPNELAKILELIAEQMLLAGTGLSYAGLKKVGLSPYYYVFTRHYPGGFKTLRYKLGISTHRRQETNSSEEANEELRKLLIYE